MKKKKTLNKMLRKNEIPKDIFSKYFIIMESIVFDILSFLPKLKFVVGYDLPISPITYEVDIKVYQSMVNIENTFFVLPEDKCGIPFCCLFPACQEEKVVVDNFTFDKEHSTLILQRSSAFCGLITLFERGKTFNLYNIDDYVIFVHSKEIFIMSEKEYAPTKDQKQRILDVIRQCPRAPKTLNIRYF